MKNYTISYSITRHILFSALTITFSLLISLALGESHQVNAKPLDSLGIKLEQRAEVLRYEQPDSAIIVYLDAIEVFKKQQDTVELVQAMVKVSHLYAHTAKYSSSYDLYWEALLIAEKANNQRLRAIVYNGLGWLYSFYDRQEKAIEYFNLSVDINRKLYSAGALPDAQPILDDYYALLTLYRKKKDIKMARAYIDSCLLTRELWGLPDEDSSPYINAELGYILFLEGRYHESLKLLYNVKEFFIKVNPSYLVILYPFIGDNLKGLGRLSESEKEYQKALEISEKYHSHLDYKPSIYERMSELYFLKKEFDLAYHHLKIANALNEAQFGSRSENNKGVLAIKDNYRLEKERQEDLQREQKLTLLEQEKQLGNLQVYLLVSSIAFIILLGLLFYRYLRSKHKSEKKVMRKKQQLEIQKTREVLDIKNKELTTSALQAIEKEELLAELKAELQKLKKEPNPKEISKLIKNIDLNTSRSWEEFELRFLAVNDGFYNRLKEKYPTLSQNDQKICALIKLHFNSKDMAKLLGISVESVHTSRYRLRKKLNLDRNMNLEDHIAKV